MELQSKSATDAKTRALAPLLTAAVRRLLVEELRSTDADILGNVLESLLTTK